jgi:outer membrane lipopolysaccharide assembly protein LptE/RlpB
MCFGSIAKRYSPCVLPQSLCAMHYGVIGRKMYRKHRNIWLTAIILLMICGCGYHLTGSGDFPEGVSQIYIEVFKNNTSESGVENIVTRNMINEFTLREEQSLATNIGSADAILGGAVTRIFVRTIASKGESSASERRVTVSVDFKLTGKDGKLIWAAKKITDNEAYPVSTDKNVTESNKRIAIDDLSKRIVERALNRLTDGF